jgi:hypothetical protein
MEAVSLLKGVKHLPQETEWKGPIATDLPQDVVMILLLDAVMILLQDVVMMTLLLDVVMILLQDVVMMTLLQDVVYHALLKQVDALMIGIRFILGL